MKKKTMLPELLPTPRPNERGAPPDRVAARAKSMLERFRNKGSAGAAAVLTAHCTGYGVVDPLPPPPEHCTEAPPDAFASLVPFASFDRSAPVLTPPVKLTLASDRFEGLGLVEARAMGATITSSVVFGTFETRIEIVLAPETSTSTMHLEVDLSCGPDRLTRRFRVQYRVPDAVNDSLSVDEL